MSFSFARLSAALVVLASPAAWADPWEGKIDDLKKCVVNLVVRSEVSFGLDVTGETFATGFIADAKRGLIVTNEHITGSGPVSKILVTFSDGSTVDAKPFYYDPWHDFVFLKFDPAKMPPTAKAVRFGRFADLKENEDLLLIGNNEREDYSIKRGKLTKRFTLKAFNEIGRYSHHLHTDFDRTGGSSGSPVWNAAGEVVGLHTGGTDTSSFELRIDYVTDAFRFLEQGKVPPRGEIGASLWMIPVSEARDYYGVPLATVNRERATDPDLKFFLTVERLLHGSEADRKLKMGDLVLDVEGKAIGQDAYGFDRILNEKVGGTVRMKVFRNGKEIDVALAVEDAEQKKLARFVQFAGGVFHDVSPGIGLQLNVPLGGVFLSQVNRGSSFEPLARPPSQERTRYKRKAIVSEINGTPVKNLDDFIRVASNLKSGSKANVLLRDVERYGDFSASASVDIEDRYSPFEIFKWNATQLEWETESQKR
jgi:S1-C subfamily serine protease